MSTEFVEIIIIFFFFFKKKSSFGYKNEHIKEKIIKMNQDHMKTEEHTQT